MSHVVMAGVSPITPQRETAIPHLQIREHVVTIPAFVQQVIRHHLRKLVTLRQATWETTLGL